MSDKNHLHIRVNGSDIDFPLIVHMGTNRYNRAVLLGDYIHRGYELVYVVDGVQAYETVDGQIFTIHGGQYSFMPPNIQHRPCGG